MYNQIDTPSLIVDKGVLLNNIKKMGQLAKEHKVKLRPHIKAHKCSEIAKIQLHYGAVGVTVAKLEEARIMFDGGVNDILLANQLVSDVKLEKLFALKKQGALIKCLVDNLEQVKLLSSYSLKYDIPTEIYVEVDTGLKRTGLLPQDTVGFVREIMGKEGIIFSGILTHAGHVYGADKDNVPQIGQLEGTVMAEIAKELKNIDVSGFEVSVGSTPTVKYSAANNLVTEIRPGNYVFNDAIQVALGTAEIKNCSLKVLATVISKPAPDRLIIDAGSKTLALDKGAHGAASVKGFGIIENYPNLLLDRLSEEHGIVTVAPGNIPRLGEELYIIPNHACTVVNLADKLLVLENGKINESWTIDARGKNK
ncbi:MAG: alanine racemase [Bacillota bacterium]